MSRLPASLASRFCAASSVAAAWRQALPGGMQEETTALGVPCLTMRENTERPITVDQGTNTMVGRDIEAIRSHTRETLAGHGKSGRVPELWDGLAAERIAAGLGGWLIARHQSKQSIQ